MSGCEGTDPVCQIGDVALEHTLREAERIARTAGQAIRALRERGAVAEQLKNGVELVTEADLLSHRIIAEELERAFPGHILLSEEGVGAVDIASDRPLWVADPLDGTVGYANHHYQAAVSLALCVGGEVCCGVVYNPFADKWGLSSDTDVNYMVVAEEMV